MPVVRRTGSILLNREEGQSVKMQQRKKKEASSDLVSEDTEGNIYLQDGENVLNVDLKEKSTEKSQLIPS